MSAAALAKSWSCSGIHITSRACVPRRCRTRAVRPICYLAGYGEGSSSDGTGQSFTMGESTPAASGVAPPPSRVALPPPMYGPELQAQMNEVWNTDLDKGAVTGDLATLGVRWVTASYANPLLSCTRACKRAAAPWQQYVK